MTGFFDYAEKGKCIDCGKETKRREPGLSGTGIDSVFYCAKCKKKNNQREQREVVARRNMYRE